MQLVSYPDRKDWKLLLQRPYVDNSAVMEVVRQVFTEVKNEGDEAVRAFTKKFSGVDLRNFQVNKDELAKAEQLVSPELKKAIQQAGKNIEAFHKSQLGSNESIETMPGVECWRRNLGIEKVGLYIPGGTAPLFSTVLMLAIPAALAGCREIILCTPPDDAGQVHPAVLYAAQLTGITKMYKIGGAQAIAAMTFGTATVPSVYKLFGPGNQYVTAAKQLAQMHGVAIDMPAGPSEVCVLADATADPVHVAADLLSQAEHGTDSQVLLVSNDAELVKKTEVEVARQLKELPRKKIAEAVLSNSRAIVVATMEEAMELVNEYAAEHLIINCSDAEAMANAVVNAGAVFIGSWSPESAGDYASGTNHTLPTNGFAKAYGGLSVDSFVKKITFQRLSEDGLRNVADTVITMAEAEGLQAHANAVRVRL
jgi:histidinol dehydrogenase